MKHVLMVGTLTALSLLTGCQSTSNEVDAYKGLSVAQQIAKKHIIVDGHIAFTTNGLM